MEIKDFKFKIKSDDISEDKDILTFKGVASPFDGKKDLGGDIIQQGAFKRTLDLKGSNRILLWHHKTEEPIGNVILEETENALEVKEGTIELGIQKGREMAILVRKGSLKGLSIGYEVPNGKSEWKNDSRILKEINLWELSLVPFPMNVNAGVTDLKNISFDEVFSSCEKLVESYKDKDLTKDEFARVNSAIKSFNLLLLSQKNADTSIEILADDFDSKELEKELEKLINIYKGV